MTERSPDDRTGDRDSDHMGALRPDDPLEPYGDDDAGDVSQESLRSADEDREDAEVAGSTGERVEADTAEAADVTTKLT
jgi:hypothetical protein